MTSKFEIGYIVTIYPYNDQSIFSGSEGVITNKSIP